jgi:HSP20 family protein
MGNLMKVNRFLPTFSNFFDEAFTKEFFNWDDKNFAANGGTLPSVNVRETDKEYFIELAAPGLKKEDCKVEMKNDMLTISAERKDEKEEKRGDFTRREFNYSSFCRSFYVPDLAEKNKVDAKYEDGMLTIMMAKKMLEEPKPKFIEIH